MAGNRQLPDCAEYVQAVRRATRFLSRDEEQALARRMKAGDMAARETLILSILPMAIRLATWFWKRGFNQGIPFEDLVQLANTGVIHAVGKFDPDRGFRLTTYAHDWIKQRIRMEVMRGGSHIISKGRKTDWLAAVCSLSDQYAGTDGVTIGDGITAPECDPSDDLVRAEYQAQIAVALDELPPRDREVIHARIHGERLEELGARLGLTKERVRQIEKRAVRHLCEALGVADCETSLNRMGFVGTKREKPAKTGA